MGHPVSVTKARQAAGSWSVNLYPDTPLSLTDQLDIERTTAGFGHIIITPAPVDISAIAVSDLLNFSIYTGVCRKQEDRTGLSGSHASIWLGDQDGKADLNETSTGSVAKTFANWVAAIRPAQLSAGTVTNPSASTKTYLYYWINQDYSPRMALDTICDMFGAEWEVTDQLTLNAATSTTLYGSTPTVICSPWWQGRDSTYAALRSTIGYTPDLEDYTTRVLNLYNSGASGIASAGSTSYKDGLGNTLVWKRRIESPDVTDATAAQGIAHAAKTRFNAVTQNISIATDSPAVMSSVRCGTYIYAYNPDVNLYDMSNQVIYMGQTIFPVSTRVEQIDMPITPDLGVYFIRGDQTVIDLNKWTVRESPGARLTVGAPRRRLAPRFRGRMRKDGA